MVKFEIQSDIFLTKLSRHQSANEQSLCFLRARSIIHHSSFSLFHQTVCNSELVVQMKLSWTLSFITGYHCDRLPSGYYICSLCLINCLPCAVKLNKFLTVDRNPSPELVTTALQLRPYHFRLHPFRSTCMSPNISCFD